MKHNPRYTLKHLSVRVPWHDNSWNGTVCNNPLANGACLVLKTCSQKRNDQQEKENAGKTIKELDEKEYPVCVDERAAFMSPFGIPKTLTHPYIKRSPSSHGNLKATSVIYPAYSAPCIPYHWMLKENAPEKADHFSLQFDMAREPELDFVKEKKGKDNWVQEYSNQKALLNCFFEHFEEETSLVFFYAKQVPFVEDSGRVLVGAGRIAKIIPSEAYDGSNDRFSAAYWEHMILHTIRKGGKDGFLLPYHEALTYQAEHPEFDVAELAVKTPGDKQFEFSYAAEHVSNDSAIRVLLECQKSLEKAQELGVGEGHEASIGWIHNEIAKLEKLRGHYPGMGSALCAFGVEKGHFVAAEIINGMEEDANPWGIFETLVEGKETHVREEIADLVGFNTRKTYLRLRDKSVPERLNLLHLLSRFDITVEQATQLFIHEEREKLDIQSTDKEYLVNPYLIYEELRLTNEPVDRSTIDLGLYLKNPPEEVFPENLVFEDPLNDYRIRALTIEKLEYAALLGHTLLPRKQVINQIREASITPPCPVNSDYFEGSETVFDPAVHLVEMQDGERAYQLDRFAQTREIIAKKVSDRIAGRRLVLGADWRLLIDTALTPHTKGTPDNQELKAREEKSAALKEVAESRISVLIGPAGTGKTTLLTILAGEEEVRDNGVLLLAPTGKARVRMEEVAKGLPVTAKTLAQFLHSYKRYNGAVQRYVFSDKFCEGMYETVILDEASMLTEEMLATTMDCLKGVKRFILVGDHRQLPPIGAGRPFLDIINYLKPENVESTFPRVGEGKGYSELTIKRRQGGSRREDIQLAEWFSGEPLEPGADSIINKILTHPNSEFLRIEKWEKETDFEKLFENVLIEELELESFEDAKGFNLSLGSTDNGIYFNIGAAESAEKWQILTPVNEKVFGVKAINRKIHKSLRKGKVEYANSRRNDRIPSPVGLEEIVYGDKVINLANQKVPDKRVWPKDDALNFIANGEIGMVIGQMKAKWHTFKGRPKNTEVEFTSQKGFRYTFYGSQFSEEKDSPLELAYALTVHKSQGSEFGKVILVIPNPCFLLTREMLYTALTRQKDKVILLYQGSVFDIKELASPLKSDALKRITNLFRKPELVEVDGQYLERNLIHQASDGKMLRSKSEQMIYQRLLDNEIEVLYEKKLTIKDVEKLPDFTIENDDTGEVYYWEHCGMLFNDEYKERWEEKYQWYRENDILPFEEGGGANGTLIISEDKPNKMEDGSIRGSISYVEIDELILKVFSK
jgi:ATP-dependent exoDNAse (exonuclease V) alpha subunit